MPVKRLYSYFIYTPLDVGRMREAAAYLEGKHDFKSFCSAKTAVEDTVRTILSCTVERTPQDVIVIRVTGTGFLYNMVRIIAGTLIQVGIGEIEPQDIEIILAKRERGAAGPTAPAHGLTMIGIAYEGGKGGSL